MARTKLLLLALVAVFAIGGGTAYARLLVANAPVVAQKLTPEELEVREIAKAKEAERLAKDRERLHERDLKFLERLRERQLAAAAKAREKKKLEGEEDKQLLAQAKAEGRLEEEEAIVLAKEEKAALKAAALKEHEREAATRAKERHHEKDKEALERDKAQVRELREAEEPRLKEKKERERAAREAAEQRLKEREERERLHREEAEAKLKAKEAAESQQLAEHERLEKEPGGCFVKHGGSIYASLTAAVEAVQPGATLTVSGTCVGHQEIHKSVTVVGLRGATLAGGFDREHPGKVLSVNEAGTVRISHLTVTGGYEEIGAGIGIVNAAVTLEDVSVTGNKALISEECIGGAGGGIYNAGNLTLTGSTVAENAGDEGGGIYNAGTALIESSRIENNTANLHGGGIDNNVHSLTVVGSTVSGNGTSGEGGGIETESGSVVVEGSTVSDNTADNGGGIYANDIICIEGQIKPGTIAVTDSAITGNAANGTVEGSGQGGGIANIADALTLNGSTSVTSNTAGTHGGGIFNGESAGATLTYGGGFSGSVSGNTPDDVFDG